MATNRAKREERRYASARDRAEKTASSGFSRTAYRVPEGMQPFSLKKAGVYRIDILPFKAGEGNPFAEEGLMHFERTFFQHRDIGLDEDAYVCLRSHKQVKDFKRFDLCPICKYMQTIVKSDPALAKKLTPKERQLFNVVNLAEPDEGVLLWEISFHLFGKLLDSKVRLADDNEYDEFSHLERGMTLKLGVQEKSMGADTRPFYEVTDIEFKARKEQYDESWLERTAVLDDLLIQLDYEKLEAIFFQTSDGTKNGEAEEEEEPEEEDEAPAPRKKPPTKKPPAGGKKPKPSAPPADEEEEEAEEEDRGPTTPNGIAAGDMVEHDEFGTCEVTKVNKDGTKLWLDHAAGSCMCSPLDVEPIDPDAEEEEAEEEAPPPRKKPPGGKKPTKKPTKPADEEEAEEEADEEEVEDDWEDPEEAEAEEEEEEEPPPPRKKPPTKKPSAPPPKRPTKKPPKK